MKNRIIDDEFINRLDAITLHMQSPMQGYFGGNHRTKAYGSTVEFADFREYTLGDDIRRIDWNLFARFEKHFIRLFVDERQMHIQIFVDCSASMSKADDRKAFFAMRVAAALGYLSVRNMDKLSYGLIHGEKADMSDVITGKDAFFRATAELEQTVFGETADIKSAILGCIDTGASDGLTVIISDFMTDESWKGAVDYLLYKHREVLLIQVLSPDEINPQYSGRLRLTDVEASEPTDDRHMKMKITRSDFKAYKAALAELIGGIKKFSAARGVHFITTSCDAPIEKLLYEKLFETGTLQ